jgi:hypothetical protein
MDRAIIHCPADLAGDPMQNLNAESGPSATGWEGLNPLGANYNPVVINKQPEQPYGPF